MSQQMSLSKRISTHYRVTGALIALLAKLGIERAETENERRLLFSINQSVFVRRPTGS
jgi:hypothetical protein